MHHSKNFILHICSTSWQTCQSCAAVDVNKAASACKASRERAHTWVLVCPQIDSDLRDTELDYLRAQLALERERSNALSQRLADSEDDLCAASARVNTRTTLGGRRAPFA
jgi:hypothetical protein